MYPNDIKSIYILSGSTLNSVFRQYQAVQQVLSCETSAKNDILSRYGKFCRGLRTSVSGEVRVLFNLVARDLQSTTAKNIKFVQVQSGTDLWAVGSEKLKQALQQNTMLDIPAQEEWKVNYLGSLLTQLGEASVLVQDDRVIHVQELIDSLVR